MTGSEIKRANEWIIKSEIGTSSKTIWAVMMGVSSKAARHSSYYNVPLDVSDFRRCYQLLVLIPEWRSRLAEVAVIFPSWKHLVEHWDEMTTLYEKEKDQQECPLLWQLMLRLRHLGEKDEDK